MALSVAAVTKTFGGLTALRNVSLSLEPGEIHGLIGPNGSGKTTLLRVLLGQEEPSGGEVKRGHLNPTLNEPLPPDAIRIDPPPKEQGWDVQVDSGRFEEATP